MLGQIHSILLSNSEDHMSTVCMYVRTYTSAEDKFRRHTYNVLTKNPTCWHMWYESNLEQGQYMVGTKPESGTNKDRRGWQGTRSVWASLQVSRVPFSMAFLHIVCLLKGIFTWLTACTSANTSVFIAQTDTFRMFLHPTPLALQGKCNLLTQAKFLKIRHTGPTSRSPMQPNEHIKSVHYLTPSQN